VFFPPGFTGPPPVIIPPVLPPVESPCDPDVEDCDGNPPEPPTDVPEPGLLILLITGILVMIFAGRRRTI
jgi:hypothetical protein